MLILKKINKLLLSLLMLLCICCKNSPQQEINIQNLKESFKKKNETQFLRQFPNDFNQFNTYFGYDSTNDKPEELYQTSIVYIDYWFNLLNNEKYKAYEKHIISIGVNGHWEADALNYFQDKSLNYIKENNKYYLINELKDEEVKSVLFFLFDGPHPEFDNSFASHLNDSKKKILDEVFKNDLFDHDDVEEDIDFYILSDYISNDKYFLKDVDINNDGVLDKIVSNQRYQGDELLLFINNNNTYEFALKTINFSEDGGNQIIDIKKSEKGFIVVTAFPDRGFFEAHYYISLLEDKWVLTNTIYKTQSSNQENTFIYVCDVKQGLDISKTELLSNIKWIPEEFERDKVCLKQSKAKLAKIDSVSISEIKGLSSLKYSTIFAYYKHEKIDEVDIWSDKMFGRCCTETDLSYSELLEFDITANVTKTDYPYSNLTDIKYTTAFAFKEDDNIEIAIKLNRNRNNDWHESQTGLLVDDVLKSNDTLLKPFKLSLVNGYVKSEKTFIENGRVKELKVFLNNNYIDSIKLLDIPLAQKFKLDFVFFKNDTIMLKPVSYYKGTKYDDICISEIQSSLAHITHPSINKKYKVRELLKKGYALKKN